MTWKFNQDELELHGFRSVHERMKELLVSEAGMPVPTVTVMYDYLGDAVWIRGIVSPFIQRYRRSNNRSWIQVGVYTERPTPSRLALDIYEAMQRVHPSLSDRPVPEVSYEPNHRKKASTLSDDASTGLVDSRPVLDASGDDKRASVERFDAVRERIRKASARLEKKSMVEAAEGASVSVVDTLTDSSVVDAPKTSTEGEKATEAPQALENAGVERREVEILVNGERINVATPILRSDSDPSTSSDHGFRVILEFR